MGWIGGLAISFVGVLLATSATASPSAPPSKFDCVEVELFKVNRDEIKSKKDKRAAMIGRDVLAKLQEYVVLEVPLSIPGMKGMYANEETCPDPERALVFGGQITDYKPGSKALRYWVGMGAGAQKFAVDAYVKEKATGRILVEGDVVDRKIGGLLGGEDDKGVDDFSEKAASFIREALE